LIEFLSENFLFFLSTYQTLLQSDHSEKKLLMNAKRVNIGTVAKPTLLPLFEYKIGDDSGRYFYLFRSWTCKRVENLDKIKQKKRSIDRFWTKKDDKSHFWYKLHNII